MSTSPNSERNALIVKLWNKNVTTKLIAISLGVTTNLVSSVIYRSRAAGKITRPKVTTWTNDERNFKIVDLWNDGLSSGEVARALGVSKNIVLATVVKHRALGDIVRPMVDSRSDRGKLGIIARFGVRKRRGK